MALSLSPLQMTSMQGLQMNPLTGVNSGEAPQSQQGMGQSLADLAFQGKGIPWGGLYDDLQTEYWNRLLRDPSSGNFQTVKARTSAPIKRINEFGEEIEDKEYSDWQDVSVLDYLRDMEKYNSNPNTPEPYTEYSPDGSNLGPIVSDPYENTAGQGVLADYFNYLTQDRSVLKSTPSFMQGAKWEDYGDNLLSYLENEGVDLTNSRPWVQNNSGSDYESVKSNYLDQYLNDWVYNGAFKNEPSYGRFGKGAEAIRWFGDDPNLNERLLQGTLSSTNDPSLFSTVNRALGQYASKNDHLNYSLSGTWGRNLNRPNNSQNNIYSDTDFDQWTNSAESLRKYQAAKRKASRLGGLGLIASFLTPFLGPVVGSALGLSGTTASVVGSGLVGGLTSGLTGGNPLTGALTGGVGAGLGAAFNGINGFSAADAAQLAGQGLSSSQIGSVLGYSGVGPGAAGLYGTLAPLGLTNPGFANAGASLIKGGAKSLISGQKFDPVRSALGGYLGPNIGQLPTTLAIQALR